MATRAINVQSGSTKVRTQSEERFLAEARKYPVLTAEEELELVFRIQKGDESAKSELVNSNLRFIYSLASKFARGDEVLDLCSLATIGMMTAMDSYDATRGVRFLSYAVHYMRMEISAYYAADAQLVRNKTHHNVGTRAAAVNEKFFAENGRMPSEDELVEILNDEYDMEIKDRISVIRHSYSSLDSRIDEDGATAQEVGEIAIATASRNEAEVEADKEDAAHKVNVLLASLPLRYRTILEMSFGLGEYEGIEHEDDMIADRLGITRERVRQIRLKSLELLKGRAAMLGVA